MAYRSSAAGYIAQLRQEQIQVREHERRLALTAPLTPAQEQHAIERYMATKGVTKCPTAYAEGALGETFMSAVVPAPGKKL